MMHVLLVCLLYVELVLTWGGIHHAANVWFYTCGWLCRSN